MGRPLTATLEHPESKIKDGVEGGIGGVIEGASYQWQRSVDGVTWQTIIPSPSTGAGPDGGDSSTYTPTEADAGHRLRVIAIYTPPGGEGLALAGLVTPPLPGEAPPAPATEPEGATEPETRQRTRKQNPALAPAALSVALLPGGDPATGDPVIAYLVGGLDGMGGLDGLVWSRWEWQRSRDGVAWQDIAGAAGDYYEPTPADAGHFLRVIFTYVPSGSLDAALAGAVTERLPGDPPTPAATAPTAAPHRFPRPYPQLRHQYLRRYPRPYPRR